MVKILVVDDEPSIIRMLKFALQKEGYKVFTAANGAEGIKTAIKEQPHLVCSDIMMPVMDGIEMCEKLRQQPSLKNIPFIFLTAKGDMSTQIKGLQSGADDFIVKPIDFKSLFIKIHKMLNIGGITSETGLSDPELFQEVKLSGNFAAKKASDILQIVEDKKLTGILTLEKDEINLGEFSFHKGRLISAAYEEKSGKNAFFALLSSTGDDYNFTVRPVSYDKSKLLKVSTLIMEWTTSKATEEKKKQKVVLRADSKFDVVLVPDFFNLTANDDVQLVIKTLQQGNSFGDLLKTSGLSKERLLKIFSYLLSKNILKQK